MASPGTIVALEIGRRDGSAGLEEDFKDGHDNVEGFNGVWEEALERLPPVRTTRITTIIPTLKGTDIAWLLFISVVLDKVLYTPPTEAPWVTIGGFGGWVSIEGMSCLSLDTREDMVFRWLT